MSSSSFSLELHNVSYMIESKQRSVRNRILCDPPLLVQALNDVTLRARSGELMGVIGATGCGKTSLLEAISHRGSGILTGSITLHHLNVTPALFQRTGVCTVFRDEELLSHLTVKETLRLHACLHCAGEGRLRNGRVNTLIEEFALDEVSSRRVSSLDVSARRRLIVAMHLVSNPRLVLLDEPLRSLPPLQGYQLMSCLSHYARRHNTIVLLTLRLPRSDIYPLLDTSTLLFFGQIVYTGATKDILHYFRRVGIACPVSENPAVYFASLATLDRENADRYVETRDQAIKLVEIFKADRDPFERATHSDFLAVTPLLTRGDPFLLTQAAALMRQTLHSTFRSGRFLPTLLLAPLFAALFCLPIASGADAVARTGVMFNVIMATACTAAGMAVYNFAPVHRLYAADHRRSYSFLTFIMSHLVALLPLHILSAAATTALYLWSIDQLIPAEFEWSAVQAILITLVLVLSVSDVARLQAILISWFIASPFHAAAVAISVTLFELLASAGVLKSITEYVHSPIPWYAYASLASPFRYISQLLMRQALQNVDFTCRDGAFCRWNGSTVFLESRFPSEPFIPVYLGLSVPFFAVLLLFFVVVALFTMKSRAFK